MCLKITTWHASGKIWVICLWAKVQKSVEFVYVLQLSFPNSALFKSCTNCKIRSKLIKKEGAHIAMHNLFLHLRSFSQHGVVIS